MFLDVGNEMRKFFPSKVKINGEDSDNIDVKNVNKDGIPTYTLEQFDDSNR